MVDVIIDWNNLNLNCNIICLFSKMCFKLLYCIQAPVAILAQGICQAFVSSILSQAFFLPLPALTLSTFRCIVLVVRFGIVLAFSIGGVPIGVLTVDPSAGGLRSVLGVSVWWSYFTISFIT